MKILLSLLVPLFLIGCDQAKQLQIPDRPNILLIFTDQQHIDMMSAMGNNLLHTPNMDRLAKRGVMFKNSYCTSPVCGPARSSIISGRMPHETGVEWNGDSMNSEIKNIGEILREHGYKTVWGGKWHLPESYPQRAKAKNKDVNGFDLLPFRDPNIENWMLGSETDPPLTKAAVNFIKNYDAVTPFFLAVSYHNPHDICFYPRKEGWVTPEDSLLNIRYYNFDYKLPDEVGTHPSNIDHLPPLPDNYEVDEHEPEFIQTKRHHHNEYGLETKLAFQEFGDLEWQGYLNAYHRLTEDVDKEIGQVLDALEAQPFNDSTIIIFTSDHGDGAAAHQWAAKLSLYKESAMVPMLVSYPAKIAPDQINDNHLVSQIDIVPTLCDYAGITPSVPFTGNSLRSIIEDSDATWREYIVVELADFKPDRSRKGRMVRTAEYKFNIFNQGQRNMQLFNLHTDSGENENLAFHPDYTLIVDRQMQHLKEWIAHTNDNFNFSN
ncbi:MAG: sulfatase-like hydrolase/transferase [Saprospiraceae bacterium]|nr:sulfatase-like hydrolase/transferase [Saprospiraceae bacterium]